MVAGSWQVTDRGVQGGLTGCGYPVGGEASAVGTWSPQNANARPWVVWGRASVGEVAGESPGVAGRVSVVEGRSREVLGLAVALASEAEDGGAVNEAVHRGHGS